MECTIILHLEPEEGSYIVTVPALTGCETQGETSEKAIAKNAIAVCVESLKKYGEPIPEENKHPRAMGVDVAA
jgi:antitoxin HicB